MDNLIDDYSEIKQCFYKNECYSVRDNGAVFRHAKDKSRPRKYDEYWTFGIKNKQGYRYIGEHRVHIIVATAFYGENDSKKYVVDHIDTNRCNNRVKNLRWFTRLENVFNNPVTLKKITYLCGGDIQKFLDNPSCLKNITGNNQDVLWMRTVSSDEAKAAYKKIMQLNNMPMQKISDGKKRKSGIGEWIFKESDYSYKPVKLIGNYYNFEQEQKTDILKKETKNCFVDSLTPNAIQKNWTTPTYFPLCPNFNKANTLDTYYIKLRKNIVISENSHSIHIIKDYVMYDNMIIIRTEVENNIKPYGIMYITLENGKYIHEGNTFFKRQGAKKAFTLAQNKEWKGLDGIDDYC